MDFFFVEYRDPIVGLVVLTILIFMVASIHYVWQFLARKDETSKLNEFIKKFDIDNSHKELLRASSLSLNNLNFLALVFTKSGEFEKAIQIYLIALEKTKNKDEQEILFYALAEVYFKAGFLQKSVEVLLNALKIRPRNEKALKLLKINYLKLKRYDEVENTLESLFELGINIDEEKALIKAFYLQNQALSQNIKIEKSLELSQNNSFVKRFIIEQYKQDLKLDFDLIIDVLWRRKIPVFLDDEQYFEFFYALDLTDDIKEHNFKNSQLKMLYILKKNDFKAKLSFSYICTECKNTMPLFFYHCPFCYEFGSCKIVYEVKSDERN